MTEKRFLSRRNARRPPAWVRLLRPHHWIKNFLLFVPALTTSAFLEPYTLVPAVVGFVSFTLAASAGYVINDLTDQSNDRMHPQKKTRPLASGELSPRAAIFIGMFNLGAASVLSFGINLQVGLLIVAYLSLTTLYSIFLKRLVYVDIAVLVSLYAIRVLAGAAAIEVELSAWLATYTIALFLSLASLKRYAEINTLAGPGVTKLSGRAYSRQHLGIFLILGLSAGLFSMGILGSYISNPLTAAKYGDVTLLWSFFAVFGGWLCGVWVATIRGNMASDPVVFALSNPFSLACVAVMVSLALAAQLN